MLATNIGTGLVVGQFGVGVADGPDVDREPEVIPLSGSITFTPSIPYLPNVTADPNPITIVTAPIKGVLDEEGYLCTPAADGVTPQYRGIRLFATDDPDGSVKNWTYSVAYRFNVINGATPTMKAHSMSLPEGSEVDLTTIVEVPSSPGVGTPQALALLALAQDAAARSAVDADVAARVAQSVRDDADAGVFKGETGPAGPNTVPTDEFNAALIEDPESLTGTALVAAIGGEIAGKLDRSEAEATYAKPADIATALNDTLPAKQDKASLDIDVTGKILEPASGVATALFANIAAQSVGRGELFVSVKDHGAVGDGIADDTVAWINAEAAAFAKGPDAVLFAPYGRYRTSGTVSVRCQLEASQATIRYYGTGTAMVMGDESALGKVTPRRKFKLPRVVNMSRGTTGWDGTSIGVKLVNLDTCSVYVPFVQDFESGLVLSGQGSGTAYNVITLGALWDNHKNLTFKNDATGWANQNTFIGGRFNQTIGKGAFLDDPGANQVSMIDNTSFGGSNQNTFIGSSFEGVNVSYYRFDIAGKYNRFINCRYENFGTTFRVRYRETAELNEIDGGYDSWQITEIFDGVLGGGALRTPFGAYAIAYNTGGQLIPDTVWTPINSWNTPTVRYVTYNSSTGEFTPRPGRWAITATVTFAPNATGRRIVRIKYAGGIMDVTEAAGPAGSTSRVTLKLATSIKSNGVDKILVECQQTSGASLALEPSAPYVKFQAEYLGG